jgi:hypothetical protein
MAADDGSAHLLLSAMEGGGEGEGAARHAALGRDDVSLSLVPASLVSPLLVLRKPWGSDVSLPSGVGADWTPCEEAVGPSKIGHEVAKGWWLRAQGRCRTRRSTAALSQSEH